MIRKKISVAVAFVLVACISSYYYIATRIFDPFIIDASKGIVEKAAPDLVNINQNYYFRLINSSDKPVRLIDIQLSNYSGMELGKLTYKGVTPNGLEIPSHRIYNSNGWTTNDQGLEIDYVVTIKEPKIFNPKTATITYSYLGIKHKQVVQIPGI